jgi:AcrR family transcriptional regulator
MSPAPARTSRDAILSAARSILEEDGLDALTMQRVADRVGIRGPSLYKHVTDRSALIRGVAESVTADLGRILVRAMQTGDPVADLRSLTIDYRAFVRANPRGYGLLFAGLDPAQQADPGSIADLGRPIVTAMRELVGEEAALATARTVVAWAHGFTTMELAGAFRLGGDIDAAYATGIDLILRGVSEGAFPRSG